MTKARDLADAGNYDLADFGDFDFPASDGTNGQALVTDGSGNLSFADAGGGKVLQVVQDVKTDYQSTSSNGGSWVDISGLSASITPSSTSSKIFVIATVQMHSDGNMFLRLVRNSTAIGVGDLSGSRGQASAGDGYNPADNRNQNFNMQHLDSPSTTSAVTYKVQFVLEPSGKTGAINGAVPNQNIFLRPYFQSTITVMEIAG